MHPDCIVSVITINRNTGSSVNQTIQSLHSQDCEFEWVVIDGGSTDHSVDLLKSSIRPNDQFISEPDSGISDAFNKGIRLARGKTLLFLNAGDSFHRTDALSILISHWDNGNRPWVTGGAAVLSAEGKLLFVRTPCEKARNIPSSFRTGCFIWHAATLIDRRLFHECGVYDTSFRLSMDYELWLRFLKFGYMPRPINDCISNFALGGMSSNLKKRRLEDKRARQLNNLSNSPLTEFALYCVFLAKTLAMPLRSPWMYRLKERLGL